MGLRVREMEFQHRDEIFMVKRSTVRLPRNNFATSIDETGKVDMINETVIN